MSNTRPKASDWKILASVFAGVLIVTIAALVWFAPSGTSEAPNQAALTPVTVPHEILEYIDDSPIKVTFRVEVPFVDGRIPNREELIELSEHLLSQAPPADRAFFSFILKDQGYPSVFATVEYRPELTYRQIREPDPPAVRNQKRAGLSYLQRKRFWMELCHSEWIHDEQWDALVESSNQSLTAFINNPLFDDDREALQTAKLQRDKAIYEKWGIKPESEADRAIINEAGRNGWYSGNSLAECERLMGELPGTPAE